ncbi:MAG: MATE family efflux transporter [Gemmatales bacterium]|nr:MATE family efflux transporter [Gemmatales bacterium]
MHAYAWTIAGSSTLVLGIIAGNLLLLEDLSNQRNLSVGLFASLLAAANVWSSVRLGILTGYERILTAQILSMVQPGLVAILGALHFFVETSLPRFETILVIAVCGSLISTALAVLSTPKKAFGRGLLPNSLYRIEYRNYIKSGLILTMHQFLVNAMTQVDIVMLGMLVSPQEVAIYHVAARVSGIVLLVFGTASTAIAPTVARYWGARDVLQFRRVWCTGGLLAFAAAGAVAAVIAVWSEEVLLVFGHEFIAARTTLMVLLCGYVVLTAFGLSDTALAMTAWAGRAVLAFAGANVVNIVANLVLIPPLGSVGAAISSAAAFATLALVLWVQARRAFGFGGDVFSALKTRAGPRKHENREPF